MTDEEVMKYLRPWIQWSCGTSIKGFRALVWSQGVYQDRCERLAQAAYAEHKALRDERFARKFGKLTPTA